MREREREKKKKKGERRTETDGWIEIEYAAIRRSRPKSFYNFNSVKCSLYRSTINTTQSEESKTLTHFIFYTT